MWYFLWINTGWKIVKKWGIKILQSKLSVKPLVVSSSSIVKPVSTSNKMTRLEMIGMLGTTIGLVGISTLFWRYTNKVDELARVNVEKVEIAKQLADLEGVGNRSNKVIEEYYIHQMDYLKEAYERKLALQSTMHKKQNKTTNMTPVDSKSCLNATIDKDMYDLITNEYSIKVQGGANE